ncbi:16S rRNA (cytosine(967)-C(5))-methyltransferase RsmB [Ornithinibacillus sp. L9]|uniref:16S rRNA (cytosine(967)-C(5))-methyltransferase n=1 Tax=Ornithinibacillus caprae TaxID=2678566 RepID=A0A6N8FJ91_9BACI|nr:16S rRNA (cytosine(967)-C(5))-methyltransferase RsmB [Ornithinibacillus caprae]MUK89483.1 16S rRNA (cytosine(967)-C(5))-methyltransferase RsmB [Ornithinibacillus caprae]
MEKFILRNTIIDLLLRIEQDSGYSHLLIDKEIKKQHISPKDEGLLTEIVYGTINRKITLDYYINHFVKAKKKMEPWVIMLLRMSFYQMIYLNKVPDHAIIHEAVEIAKRRGHKGISSLVNGVLRNVQRNGVPSTSLIEDEVERLAVETSHPTWLVKRWIKHYGDEMTKQMCEANLTQKAHSIRVQPLKISRDEAMEQLINEGYEVRPSIFSEQGIIIDKGNILKSALFKNGYVTIQDQSSMLVGEMLQPKPGMQVLDACSAPGGKVTHIAEKMENKGWIDAHDLHAKKIKLIDQKASELELTIIDAKKADARHLQELYEENSFDRILVDAPCSGLGVIRGKPDIKYNKKISDITNLATIQLAILNSVSPLLKKDGVLIYSTCTVDPEENEEVVKKFLQQNTDYLVDKSFFNDLPQGIQDSPGVTELGLQLFPQTFQTDGFFLTRFIRTT